MNRFCIAFLCLSCLLAACGGKNTLAPSPTVVKSTAPATGILPTSSPTASLMPFITLSQTPNRMSTKIARLTRAPTMTLPVLMPRPTNTPRPTSTPSLSPTKSYTLTPGTPPVGPEAYRLKPWTEPNAIAAIEEAKSISSIDLPYGSRAGWAYAPYYPYDFRDYVITLEREALLQPLSETARDSIRWDLLSRVISDAGIEPLAEEDFGLSLQEALNSGQVVPQELKDWLLSRGFGIDIFVSVENLAEDNLPGWVFQVHDTFGSDSSISAIFVVMARSLDEYKLEKIYSWNSTFHGALEFEISDRNGNGQPDITVSDFWYGVGFATWLDYRLYLYEWSQTAEAFIDRTQNIPPLRLDWLYWPGFDDLPHFPWVFGAPDMQGVQALTVPIVYRFGEKCPGLTYTYRANWDGAQYHWSGEGFDLMDSSYPIACQVGWALYVSVNNEQALKVLQSALEVKSVDFEQTWGPAAIDYLRLQLGILYALHGRRQDAVQILRTVRDQPEHPEYDMASRLAITFLDAYPAEQSITACSRTISFLDDMLDEYIPRGEIYVEYRQDVIKERWGITDPRWIWNGSDICDVQAAFRQSLLAQNPQTLEEFVLWLNRVNIPYAIAQSADITGDGTKDWIAVLKLSSDQDWQVWVIVRDSGGLKAVFVDYINHSPEDPDGTSFTVLRPDKTLLPVGVLTYGEDLRIFRLVLADQLGVEILFYDWNVDHVYISPEGQEINVYYTGSESINPLVYTWTPELQTFTSPIEHPYVVSEELVTIHSIESTLFSYGRPADAVAPLQALLAGNIHEEDRGSEDQNQYITVPLVRPYLQYLLGLAYELSGEEAKAVHAYWQIWHDYPTNPYALMARHKLELRQP